MTQPEPIVIDKTEPAVQALEGQTARLAVVTEDGSVIELGDHALDILRHSFYVPLEHAAALIGASPAAVEELVRHDALDALTRDEHVYLSLRSVLDYAHRQQLERREALAEMIRASEEGGLYDAELEAR